jgi:hypothetical protein
MIRRIILSSNTSTGALVLKPCSLLCLLTLALPHSIQAAQHELGVFCAGATGRCDCFGVQALFLGCVFSAASCLCQQQ